MSNRRLITISVVIVSLLLINWIGYNVFMYFRWRPILERNQAFIEAWGSYSYQTFDDYPQKVQSYLDSTLFNEYFSDKYSLELRKGKMITKKYSIKTELIKVTSKKFGNNEAVVSAVINETLSSNEENYVKAKNITITWGLTNKEKDIYVKNIVYQN